MKLTVAERFALQGVLPQESNFVTLRVLSALREALSFGEDEIQGLSLMTEGEQVKWDSEADGEGTEIEVGELATQIIRDALVALDKGNKLSVQHLTLYEKFVCS